MITLNMKDLHRLKEPKRMKTLEFVDSNKSSGSPEQFPRGLNSEWPSMANSHWATLKKSVNPSQLPTNKSQTPARQPVTNKSNSNPSQPGSKDDDRVQLPERIIPSATQTPRVPTQPCEKITTQVHWSSSRDARINGTAETLETHQTATQQPQIGDFSGIKGSDPNMTLGASKKTVDQ